MVDQANAAREMTPGEKAVVLVYTPVDAERMAKVAELKKLAAAYFDAIVDVENRYGRQRDFSVAKTHLQEASMWATRGLTNPE